ncbi:MAG: HAMP domain-containing histidine kinase [Proteobacteria bacterium]|nr:HAMP domain-containing histidine kinase [Pseudomonadota bacterium]
MRSLTLAAVSPRPDTPPARDVAQSFALDLAHDIRNALAVSTLHLETLERLAGPKGRKAASAAQAVLARAAALCSASLAASRRTDKATQRRGFDLIKLIREIAAILAPTAPAGFRIELPAETQCIVLAAPDDIFRIVFNLVHNAIGIARRGGAIGVVRIAIRRDGPRVVVHISDDGPGLPAAVRTALFQHGRGGAADHGFGIAIARQLAERNGSTLRLDASVSGAAYVFELPGVCAVAKAREG